MTGGKDEEEGMRMKKVIGVAALIMVVMAIVLIVFSSTASASLINRTFTQSGGTLSYTGTFSDEPRYEPAENILLVYNWESGKKAGGEKIRFFNLSSGTYVSMYVEGPYTKKAEQYSGYEVERELVPAGGVWDAEGRKTSGYFMVWEKDNESIGGWFQVVKQTFSVELGEERDKVQEGKNFNLRFKKNNKKGGVMKLTIEDNEGYSITNANGTDIYKVLVNYTQRKFTSDPVDAKGNPVDGIKHDAEGKLVFNTSQLDMTEGKYKIILEDYATEAEDEVTIKVEKRYLKVECDEEVVKGDDIIIVIWSSFYEEEINITVGDFYRKSLILDEEGKKKVKVSTKDAELGTHKITVEVCGYDMKVTKYVRVLPPKPPPTPEVSIFTNKKEYSPGDVMKTNIRISNPTDDIQKLSFKWYLGIPEYDLWAEMTAMSVNLPVGYDQTFTVPIPVGNWGKKSFCGCHIVSLTDTTTKKMVSMDSTIWSYMPGAMPESKTAAEIATEITKDFIFTMERKSKQIEKIIGEEG